MDFCERQKREEEETREKAKMKMTIRVFGKGQQVLVA